MTTYALTPHERVTIQSHTDEALVAEAEYAPGGSPPPAHLHPAQDERFEVLEGRLTVKLGKAEPRELAAGDVLDIPRGTAHAMWNATGEPARVRWETSPALRTEAWWRTLDGIDKPSLRNMAGPLREFSDVFELAVVPRPVMNGVLRVLSVGR